MTNNSSVFVRGAAILAATGLAARIIGAVFRIVLASILGDEGIGLYMYAYPVYSTLLIISTAGIPVALSKIMAENIAHHDYIEALRSFRIALYILTLSGAAITAVLVLGAEFFVGVIVGDMQALYPLLAISPAIFFVTVMASLRGFFQGQQNMVPTAASQMVEQLVRVGFSIALTLWLLPLGLEYAAAGASSGAAAGGLAGLLLLLYIYNRKGVKLAGEAEKQGKHNPVPVIQIISKLFRLAVPVTIGGLVIPLMSLIDVMVVPRRLQDAGFDIEAARGLYGQLTGMAGPVVYFPTVVALAFSMSLVPAISEAHAGNDRVLVGYRSSLSFKMTVLFSLPAAAGLCLLAEPVTTLLFANPDAGYPLAYMSWTVVPLCLYVSTTGIIQGLGRPILPAMNMFYGGLVKIILAWFLTAIPTLHVGGTALATVIGLSVAAYFNIRQVIVLTGWKPGFKDHLVLPAVSVLAMSVAVFLVYNGVVMFGVPLMSASRLNALATLSAIVLGILVYGIFLLLSGVLSRVELEMIPLVGPLLAGLAERLGVLRGV